MVSKLTTRDHTQISRRRFVMASIAASSSILWFEAKAAGPTSKTDNPINASGLFRVRAVLEVNGEIRLRSQSDDTINKNGKASPAKTAPIKATSTIDFDEQFETSHNVIGCRSYQNYHEAISEIQIDRHLTKTTLREQCRDVLRFGTKEGIATACPDNPLFAAERDLIEGPINTMFLDQLLTDTEFNIADKWTVDNDVVCRLLNMDAIHEGKLILCLVDANEDKAQLEISGSFSAAVRQVPTTIKVEGKAQFDRNTRSISWFAANLEETREISQAEPGFHVIAQLKILRSKIESMTSGLTLNSIASRFNNADAASMLQFQSDLGFYRFIANRKWSTYRDNGEEATLRYVVNDRVVAQCNVTNMIDFEPGRHLSLEGFQADVKNALGNSLREVIESSERLTSNKLRMLKVVSQGLVQGVGIQWIHYHLSIDSGRRLVLTFTLNQANLEFFSEQDAQLVESFELINWPTKMDAKTIETNAANRSKDDTKSPIQQPSTKTTDQNKRAKLAR